MSSHRDRMTEEADVGSLQNVPADRRCGARNRRGEPCRKWTMQGRTRCKNHGGATYQGYASPHYKHGWYSNEPLHRMMRQSVLAKRAQDRRVARRLRALGFELIEGEWRRPDRVENG